MFFKKENKNSGNCGEDIAVNFLKKKGYKILERNFSVHNMGEIDIIASKKDYIVFVEVKTRKSDDFGRASEFVNLKKQERIKKTALFYLNNKPETFCRFDVVEVYGKFEKNKFKKEEINHIENAF